MFAVYAAEHQYRHDTWARERDRALLASIRERTAARAPHPATSAVVPAPARAQRAPWARPIGLHNGAECTPACAPA
jgi:hypothetical protein